MKVDRPLRNPRVTAKYQSSAYEGLFKTKHFGVDLISNDKNVYAQCDGVVIARGWDNVFGNILVVKYGDLFIARYFHLASYTNASTVKRGSVIGRYGNTGKHTTGAHLHHEIDFDVVNPFYTPTLSGKSTFFKGRNYGANDSTMINPVSMWR